MWARQMELALGLWLMVSPFVFTHSPERPLLWAHDLAIGGLIAICALAAHWYPLRRAHLATLVMALWLIGSGWWAGFDQGLHPLPAYQNWMMVGLLLALFAIVPSHASTPPERWLRSAEEEDHPPEPRRPERREEREAKR